jgi:hypothetical protein
VYFRKKITGQSSARGGHGFASGFGEPPSESG